MQFPSIIDEKYPIYPLPLVPTEKEILSQPEVLQVAKQKKKRATKIRKVRLGLPAGAVLPPLNGSTPHTNPMKAPPPSCVPTFVTIEPTLDIKQIGLAASQQIQNSIAHSLISV